MSANVLTAGQSFIDGKRNHKNHHAVFFSYKKGGVASGMRHTETNSYDVKRLLHVKGKKRVIAKEVSRTAQWLCNITGKRA